MLTKGRPKLQGHHVVSMSGFSGDAAQIRDSASLRGLSFETFKLTPSSPNGADPL